MPLAGLITKSELIALASVSPTVAGSKPKNLLDQTRDVLPLKHYSLRTDQMAPVVAFNTLIVSAPFERPVAPAQQGGDSTMERITNAREKCSVESRTGLTT